jgi:hypothetical protein
MMAVRTIQHPDVEIREIDRSQTAPAIVGTAVSIMGYASKGEPYKPLNIVSVSDFETNFGQPTNEAERYFWSGAKEVLNVNGTLFCTKLPYNNTMDTNYVYVPISFEKNATNCNRLQALVNDSNFDGLQETLSGAYDAGVTHALSAEIGDIAFVTNDDYDVIVVNNDIDGSTIPSEPDFIIVNENKGVLTGEKEIGGLFLVFFDYIDGLVVQRTFSSDDTDPTDILKGLKVPVGTESYDPATLGVLYDNTDLYTTPLTGTIAGNSFSETIMRQWPNIDFTNNGEDISLEYTNFMGISVCQSSPDANEDGRIAVTALETFFGSVHPDARDTSTGQSVYLPNIINARSRFIKMYGNSTTTLPKVDHYAYQFPSKDAPIMAFTPDEGSPIINGGSVVNDMRLVFDKLSDIDALQLDVIADCGLTTIAQFCDDVEGGTIYDPENDVDPDDICITSSAQISTWRAVANEFLNFCQNTRKDCMTILDVPRNMELEGKNKKIRKTKPSNTFTNTIAPQLRFVTGLNSSYGAMYSDWRFAQDPFSGLDIWYPPTLSVAGIYVNSDNVGNFWDAPAGLNRGRIRGISDLAFQPTNKDADQLYTKSINYAKLFPVDGFILEGQKTTQTKPSAFDRVNVRRTFLRLERVTRQTLRFFIYEPNNLATRRRVFDTLNPIFASVKADGGIFDYRIVVDESNNTAESIDRNELNVIVMIKPTRTIEFILVDFVATRTDQDFSELI